MVVITTSFSISECRLGIGLGRRARERRAVTGNPSHKVIQAGQSVNVKRFSTTKVEGHRALHNLPSRAFSAFVAATLCQGTFSSMALADFSQLEQLAPRTRVEEARERESQFYEKLDANRRENEKYFGQIRSSSAEARRLFVDNRTKLTKNRNNAAELRILKFSRRPTIQQRKEVLLERSAQAKETRLSKEGQAQLRWSNAQNAQNAYKNDRATRTKLYQGKINADIERAQVRRINGTKWANPWGLAFTKRYTSPPDYCKIINKNNFTQCYATPGMPKGILADSFGDADGIRTQAVQEHSSKANPEHPA